MRDRSHTINVSLVLLAIVLSVIFTVGIIQNVNLQSTPSPATESSLGPGGGVISLKFIQPEAKQENHQGQITLTLESPGG